MSTTVATLLLFLCFTTFARTHPKQPNIVFILADDYGYNDIGYHGSEIHTPNLDRLAYEGVRLENYYIQPICTPSRSQLLSGRYQIHTGLQHVVILDCQPNALPLDSKTLPEKLREVGYNTHMVGKWHLGFYKEEYLPTSRGFDSFYGYYTGNENYYTHVAYDLSYGHRYYGYDLHDNTSVAWNDSGIYSTHLFTDRAVNITKNHNPDKPLFLYLAYQAVHSPLEVPVKYMKPYEHITNKKRRIYAGMVAAMDEGVGKVYGALKETGLLDNTIIVFSTDNGAQVHQGGNNWPLRGYKDGLWEGGVHGVGFVNSPLLRDKGTVNHELVHISDWFPTFIGLAGGNFDGTKDIDGYDQWKAISENARSPRKELLHNIDILTKKRGKRAFPDRFDTRVRAAIRVGDWKLITGNPGSANWFPLPTSPSPPQAETPPQMSCPDAKHKQNYWLFNITSDPNERLDLSSMYPQVVKHLLDILTYYNDTAVPPRFPKPDPRSNPDLHGGVWGPWE